MDWTHYNVVEASLPVARFLSFQGRDDMKKGTVGDVTRHVSLYRQKDARFFPVACVRLVQPAVETQGPHTVSTLYRSCNV